jgi:F-box and leucine-rich repeat protein 2/20
MSSSVASPVTPPGSAGELSASHGHSPTGSFGSIEPSSPPATSKGKKRLLRGFSRISSSSSLSRLGRTSSGYRSSGKSMSCVSLSSVSVIGSPYGTTLSGPDSLGSSPTGYSTAPTSVSSSPREACSPRWRKAVPEMTSVPLPLDLRPSSRLGALNDINEDYFSFPFTETEISPKPYKATKTWADLPEEIRMHIFSFLSPRDVVRCSAVSKEWHEMSFDGQLWQRLDTSDYYRDISADGLCKIITSAGPFVKDLNLRGCVQLRDRWSSNGVADACKNLENISIEGCRIERSAIHAFLLQNNRLLHVNLSGLSNVTNSAMKIIAQYCPRLEHLNVSWCKNVDTRGIAKVIQGCPNLRDLRAGEIRGWNDEVLMQQIFKRNTLERLILMNCDTLTDESLTVLLHGAPEEREYDVLTDISLAPPRKLRHLDLTRCRGVTDEGVRNLAHSVPLLEGLQLSKCHALTDDSLTAILPTVPNLTHLDLEELDELTNQTLTTLAESPCAPGLKHLSISSCENLGDSGMLPTIRNCQQLQTLDMDNTRISDLVLVEAAAMIRSRNSDRIAQAQALADEGFGLGKSKAEAPRRPRIGLRLVAFDCANVTWTGVREVLSRNAEILRAPGGSTPFPSLDSSIPSMTSSRFNTFATPKTAHPITRDIIGLKCFYNWQPTVEEHTKRVLRGDFAAANRLERKWADWMILNQEADAAGGGSRRRRRRAREAQLLHADEEDGGAGGVGGVGVVGRRRRARSGPGGCSVM